MAYLEEAQQAVKGLVLDEVSAPPPGPHPGAGWCACGWCSGGGEGQGQGPGHQHQGGVVEAPGAGLLHRLGPQWGEEEQGGHCYRQGEASTGQLQLQALGLGITQKTSNG